MLINHIMSRVPKYRMRQVFKERLNNVVDHVPLAAIKREEKAKALALEEAETGVVSEPVSKNSLKNKRTKLTTTSISDLATEPVRPQVIAAVAAAGGNPAKRSVSYAVRVTTINKGFEKDSY